MPSRRLEVIAGPMFSGKSEELIRRLRRHQIAGRNVRAFKPQIDNRYEVDRIKSHNGTEFECFPVDLGGREITMLSREHDVIGIDEAQFFDFGLQQIVKILLDRGKTVIMAGLDTTYRHEPWTSFPYFMALADDVQKLAAVCHKCGEDARYTQRLIDGQPASFTGRTIVVGGAEQYEARCANCYEKG